MGQFAVPFQGGASDAGDHMASPDFRQISKIAGPPLMGAHPNSTLVYIRQFTNTFSRWPPSRVATKHPQILQKKSNLGKQPLVRAHSMVSLVYICQFAVRFQGGDQFVCHEASPDFRTNSKRWELTPSSELTRPAPLVYIGQFAVFVSGRRPICVSRGIPRF